MAQGELSVFDLAARAPREDARCMDLARQFLPTAEISKDPNPNKTFPVEGLMVNEI